MYLKTKVRVNYVTVENIMKSLDAQAISISDAEREPCGVYCGDLLSWVMGHAEPDNAWVTIMTNKNVLAVASLIDLSVVIICENAELDEEFISTAKEKDINVIRCPLTSYEVCVRLHGLLK